MWLLPLYDGRGLGVHVDWCYWCSLHSKQPVSEWLPLRPKRLRRGGALHRALRDLKKQGGPEWDRDQRIRTFRIERYGLTKK